jgi:hypothetical protein
MRKLCLTWCAFMAFATAAISQANTVGLISYKKDKSYDGYHLLFPANQPNVYMLNTCGEVVHTWTDDQTFVPTTMAYLTPQGKLVKQKRKRDFSMDRIWSGGGGSTIEIRDWDNTLEWTFTLNDSLRRIHHDVEIMPNGNILALVWTYISRPQYTAMGRDTSKFKEAAIYGEQIIEIDPKTSQIVWQWNLADHIIQEYDATKPNYGVVADHPERININYASDATGASWIHLNAIDFNADLNQIIVSSPMFSEFWIIDHSTTTAQAATSTGGLSNVGGDLMYRWGNLSTYNKAPLSSRKLNFQHNVHWLEDFLPNTHPKYGQISVFNNRFAMGQSRVHHLVTPWDMYEWKYKKTPQGTWGPDTVLNTFNHPIAGKLNSPIVSSAQLLPNNNQLILSGNLGYAFELTPNNEVVWEYIVPYKLGIPVAQGTQVTTPNDNLTFRMIRYPVTFSGLIGKDLTSKGFLETNPNIGYCERLVPTKDIAGQDITLYPNPATHSIHFTSPVGGEAHIINLQGHLLQKVSITQGQNTIDIESLAAGLYFVSVSELGIVKAFNVMR